MTITPAETESARFLDQLQAPRRSPLIIAHRGASALAPENTLLAARLGWEAGAQAWELDVQLTRDGVPIVIHDESLARTTDVEQRFARDPRSKTGYQVGDFTFEEIQTLDAGSWFLDHPGRVRSAAWHHTHDRIDEDVVESIRDGSVRIPTLEDCLRLTLDLDWMVNVELKAVPRLDTRLASKVAEVFTSLNMAGRLLVSSFDHRLIREMSQHVDRPPLGVLTDLPMCHPARYVRELAGADAFHASIDVMGAASDGYRRTSSPFQLEVDLVRELAAATVPVLVYTVNDTTPGGLAQSLASLGVSALFTDDPEAMARCLADWERDPRPKSAA